MSDVKAFPAKTRAGLIESTVLKLFTREAKVVHVEDVGSAFRIVTLGGSALRNIAWSPGDKIQVLLGRWVQRTYTPMDWDVESGHTRILIHLHSGGPGEQWARTVRAGDECNIFGPRASLDVGGARGEIVVFGDEASIGLIQAICGQCSDRTVRSLLEVSAAADAREALARLGMGDVELFQRTEDDSHLEDVQRRLLVLAAAATTVVLTGKASSIQRLRRALKASDISVSKVLAKPYWAPGRAGLD